jgi:N-methylhydantoinase A
VIIPPGPGLLCALGDATTSRRDESARTVLRRFGQLTGAELAQILRELADEAGERLAAQGLPREEQTVGYQVDVRYHGQGFEIPVAVDPSWLDGDGGAGRGDADALTRLGEAFDAEHDRLFSFLLQVDHELVNARATVTGPRPDVAPVHLEPGDGDPKAALVAEHAIHVGGEQVDAAVYDRGRLRGGDVVRGPAIVTEMDSTTLVLPGHAATVHASGSLLINPVQEG